jgi:hypothetical protein
MKKFLFTALITVSTLSVSFAKTGDEKKVSYKVITEFTTNFGDAENVIWKVTNDYFKATFTLEDETIEAFYSTNGEFIATSQKMAFNKLPKKAITNITTNYQFPPYELKECIKYTNADGATKYFVSLKKENKTTVLEIDNLGYIKTFN